MASCAARAARPGDGQVRRSPALRLAPPGRETRWIRADAPGGVEGAHDVGGVAARGEGDHEIAGLREALDWRANTRRIQNPLPSTRAACRRRSAPPRAGTAGLEVAADQLRGECCASAGCRRGRTGAACAGRERAQDQVAGAVNLRPDGEEGLERGEVSPRVSVSMPCVGYG